MIDGGVTIMYVFTGLLSVGFVVLISIAICMLICCGESPEERAATERRAALVSAEYALARRIPAAVELSPAAPPAAPVEKKLGYFPYSAAGRRSASEKLVCAICLEEFEHGAACSEVPACRHLFHRDCIGVWMKTKTTCPLCRCHIVPGTERISAADDMV